MRRYINEGNDILNAEDMKTAIESYGGVKGCYPAVVKINEAKQTMTAHTMAGILVLNNFQFEQTGIRAWRAYNVGPGKLYTKTQLKGFGKPQGPTGMITLEQFSQPRELIGVFRKSAADSSSPAAQEETTHVIPPEVGDAGESSGISGALFSCPEDGCIKIYISVIPSSTETS